MRLRVLGSAVVAQRVCATYSAQGATSLPQVGAVSLSLAVSVLKRRQLPFLSSKKSERLKGSRVIQSSNQAGAPSIPRFCGMGGCRGSPGTALGRSPRPRHRQNRPQRSDRQQSSAQQRQYNPYRRPCWQPSRQ